MKSKICLPTHFGEEPKNTMALTVSALACPANHPCPSIRVCPESAIKQVGVGLPTIDENKCTECGACISYCPKGAFIPKD